jgi:hypothetical protein
MAAVNLDDLAHAATVVDSGDGETHALVSRETGLIHMLNDEYMDDEASVPGDDRGDGEVAQGAYVPVPAASALGLGDALVFRFASAHLPGDGETVRELLENDDINGFSACWKSAAKRMPGNASATRKAVPRWAAGARSTGSSSLAELSD